RRLVGQHHPVGGGGAGGEPRAVRQAERGKAHRRGGGLAGRPRHQRPARRRRGRIVARDAVEDGDEHGDDADGERQPADRRQPPELGLGPLHGGVERRFRFVFGGRHGRGASGGGFGGGQDG